MTRLNLAPWQLSFAAAVFIVAANNGALFVTVAENLDLWSLNGAGFVLAVFMLMVFVLNTILAALGVGPLQKPLIALLCISTAFFGYFANSMGVVFDEAMFSNAAATVTDGDTAEAFELMSPSLLLHVLAVGVLPSLALLFVRVRPAPLLREIGTRLLVTFCGLALLAAILVPTYRFDSFFAVEHRELRFRVMPIFPMVSLVKLVRDELHQQQPFHVLDADASLAHPGARRSIGIMVVGETARADRFSLDGYGRNTNPALGKAKNVWFADGESCGTSTLFSVPCMFFLRGRENYSPETAIAESNVLDILTTAGVQTIWIDNNSSCKNVCDRIENINLRDNQDPSSPYFTSTGYYDEALLQAIDPYLQSDAPNLLIVLHMLGSHGPAYSRRYPPQFGVFAPYCQEISPTACSSEMVGNAYDNTIVYTDYLLNKLIERLKATPGNTDSFLFYASDHGESLGENGVYLHGLPFSIAPEAQKDVPFIIWLSPGYQRNHHVDVGSLEQLHSRKLSHDNISHTLLGLFDVSAASYRAELDIIGHASGSSNQNAG